MRRVNPASLLRAALLVALVLAAAPPAGAQTIQTVPEVPGMRFSVDGQRFAADQRGRAYPPPAAAGSRPAPRAIDTEVAPGVMARFDRWYRDRRTAAINLYYRVTPRFFDLSGEPVDPRAVTRVVLHGSHGQRQAFMAGRPRWLQGNRVPPESRGARSSALFYVAQRVVVAGSSVVHRAQQRFFPSHGRTMVLRLLFFSARFRVRDALLGFPIGSAVRVRYPSGDELIQALGPHAELTLRSLPRGDYQVKARAAGISSARPVALSRDQEVDLRVVSWLDVAVVLAVLVSIALALLFVRRPARRLERR